MDTDRFLAIQAELEPTDGSTDGAITGSHRASPASSPKMLAATAPERLAAAFEALPQPTVVAFTTGVPLTLNAAARRLFGLESDARARSVDDHHAWLSARTPDGRLVETGDMPISRALRGERVNGDRLVIRMQKEDGAEIEQTLMVDANPIREEGAIIGATCTYRDVTERLLDEEMGDELLGKAAHDLRTPLTALKASAQLMARGLDRLDQAARARTLSLLIAQVEKLSGRIDEVLDAARIRRGRYDVSTADVDVSHALGEIVAEVSKLPGAPSCELEIEPELRAHTDRARLRQIVHRLVLESAERNGGPSTPVVVRARRVERGVEIEIESHASATRSKTARRLAHALIERLGGETHDRANHDRRSVVLTLPPPPPATAD